MAGERLHHMETYKRRDGKYAWRITVGTGESADIVATDGGQGYENEKDCLAGLMGNFFGTWDDSFLEVYQRWQSYGAAAYDVPPEAEEGVPVHVQSDADGPNYEADSPDPATDAEADDAVLEGRVE